MSASISANIKRFTALGVQVHITEMDVALPVDAVGNASLEDLQRQANIYRRLRPPVCLIPVHGDPDLGLHGQVFLDRIALENTQGAALLFDRTIGPSQRTRRCGMRWRRATLVDRHALRLFAYSLFAVRG
jgi:hypothetical protein